MRASGILMPVFSLPSAHGIGTFGKEAYRFVDFLKKAGQRYWQLLPLNPTNYGDSPYQSFSSFAGNPHFIDLDMLVEAGLLTADEVTACDFGDDPFRVDYAKLYQNRYPLLRQAFARFEPGAEYEAFCAENAWWLDDYALFMALKTAFGTGWTAWEDDLRLRDVAALKTARQTHAADIAFHKFLQFTFSAQWTALKAYANERGVQILGDIPIYVAEDSADVWADPVQFLLDKRGEPALVAGVPPDAFCEDGQLWGNPLYNWKYMKQDGYGWWKRRLQYALSLYDVVRIDHFRAFESYFAVPAGAETAKDGKWCKGPGMGLFKALGKDLPIVAEDLGFLTPAVHKLLAATGFPGMKVLQFAFDSREESDYLPHNYPHNCVVYTGTHDNDTILGWEQTAPPENVAFAKRYLHATADEGLNWTMMRAALASVADTAILTMQDLIGLGSEGRVNTPSTLGENWQWRINGDCLNDWLASILCDLTKLYSRLPTETE